MYIRLVVVFFVYNQPCLLCYITVATVQYHSCLRRNLDRELFWPPSKQMEHDDSIMHCFTRAKTYAMVSQKEGSLWWIKFGFGLEWSQLPTLLMRMGALLAPTSWRELERTIRPYLAGMHTPNIVVGNFTNRLSSNPHWQYARSQAIECGSYIDHNVTNHRNNQADDDTAYYPRKGSCW